MPNLRVVVDRQKCAGEAICVSIAPRVFDLDDDDIAVVVTLEGADPDTVLEAAESCPLDAITVVDEETGELLAA